MQQTIAKGEEARRIEVGNSTSLHLDYQVVRAIWVRSGGNNAWMLTRFQIRVPGGQKEGFDSKKLTQTATTPTRDGLGASTGNIVADSSDDGNSVFSCLQSTVLVEICARNSLFSAQALFVSLLLDRQNAALDLYRGLGSGRQAPTG